MIEIVSHLLLFQFVTISLGSLVKYPTNIIFNFQPLIRNVRKFYSRRFLCSQNTFTIQQLCRASGPYMLLAFGPINSRYGYKPFRLPLF